MVTLKISKEEFDNLKEYIVFDQHETLRLGVHISEGKEVILLMGEESLLPILSFVTERKEENTLQYSLPFD